MIRRSDIFPAGVFNKPHGVNGEIAATFDDGINPETTDCVIVDIDGIYVPFFIEGIRRKGRESFLLTIDGIESEMDAKLLVNRQIFMRAADRDAVTERDDDDPDGGEEGMYAADLIGFTMKHDGDGSVIGKIAGIDDATANVLFIVERADGGGDLLIPVADEFITDIDTELSEITVDLPDGLINP